MLLRSLCDYSKLLVVILKRMMIHTKYKNNRITELMDVLEEVEGKAIIWAHWRHDIDTIVESIEDKYPGSVVTYYGDTTTEDRQKAIKKIQDPESKVRFLVGTPQTGGYGITLTGASTMIYYSNGYDFRKTSTI